MQYNGGKKRINIDYDPQADAIYIELRASEVNSTRKVTKNLLVDLDEEEMPIGIEILSVKSPKGTSHTPQTKPPPPAPPPTLGEGRENPRFAKTPLP